MQKLTNFLSKNIFVVLILLLSIPTFYKMLQPGIYSMQDFHFFRLYEFDKCIQNLQIPCRWSPDAGLGYGEPLFNFYGQLPYAIGEIYHLVGGSIINSLKFLFILSLFGSSVSMFFLAKEIWKNNYSAFISSIIYLYAPYRAVDVWVRGALPEAFSFIFFPLILFQIFISRFWGYGGSTWGIGDGLSLSIGTIQWLLPLVILIAIVIRNKISKNMTFLTLFIVGIFYIFLTHNKSTFLWTHISGMAYIQFPWRFLGVATFCFALSSGAILQFFEKQKVLVSLIVAILAIVFNLSFFRGDIWYKVSDSYFTTGAEWTRQRTASIGDYWPQFGHKIPNLPGNGKYINYFPGWNNTPDENGLIPSSGASFKDTPIRKIGNIISLSTIIVAAIYVLKKKIWAERT